MCLSSRHPVIALWLITKLILQPQISAADAALTLSQGQNAIEHSLAGISRPCKISFLIQHYIVIIICLQCDVTECWLLRRWKVFFFFFQFPKRNLFFLGIFVLLQGLNIHLFVGEIHVDDYAEHVKSKSVQLNARLQKFGFYRSIQGNYRLMPLGSSHGFTDQRLRSGVCIAVSASMKRSEAVRQPDKRTRCVRVSAQVNSLVT